MGKRIQINEAQLRRIIAESVKKALDEGERYEPGNLLYQVEDVVNALKFVFKAYHDLGEERANQRSMAYEQLGQGLTRLKDLVIRQFGG